MRSLIMLSLLFIVAACGSPVQVTNPYPTVPITLPPSPNQSTQGVWRSTNSTQSVMALSDSSGNFYSISQNLTSGCTSVTAGTLSVTGSNVTGSLFQKFVGTPTIFGSGTGCSFSDNSDYGTIAESGSVTNFSQLKISGNLLTGNGGILLTDSLDLTFDPSYALSSSLTTIEGNWQDGSGNTISINSNGIVFAQSSNGCVVNGLVKIINSNYNMYNISLSYSNCPTSLAYLNNQTLSGLASAEIQPTKQLYIEVSAIINGSTVIVYSQSS